VQVAQVTGEVWQVVYPLRELGNLLLPSLMLSIPPLCNP
jgi:hypothetical protein